MAKKILAILAALCLVAAMGSVGAFAEEDALVEEGVLEEAVFEESAAIDALDPGVLYTSEYGKGEFNILVIPDAHLTDQEDPNLIAYIESTIKSRDKQNAPLDLVIFLGDSVTACGAQAPSVIARTVGRLLAPVIAANIPYTLVFGNHDYGDIDASVQATFSRADLLDIWVTAGGGFTDQGGLFARPDAVAGEDPGLAVLFNAPTVATTGVTGMTNFHYTIYKKIYIDTIWNDGRTTHESVNKNGGANTYLETVKFAQLFLFDIGSKDAGQSGYDYVRANQLGWFETVNNQNAGLPAFVFQHIPVPEIYTGGFFLKSPFNIAFPWTKNILGTNYCGTANFVKMVGTVLEAPNPSRYTDGWFDKITAGGNVKAAFFGHDHLNNFVEKRGKIDLVQLPGAAWNGGNGTYLVRGASFVSIRPNAAGNGVTYGNDFFTYRQASRVGGSKVGAVNKGFNDWIKVIPFLFQNLLINILAPFRWIGGGF